jgi:hypothetical protein
VPKPPEEKPVRRHLNATEKRERKAADIKRFVQAYGRRPAKGHMACDRTYDRELEQEIRRMPPEELDRILREDED